MSKARPGAGAYGLRVKATAATILALVAGLLVVTMPSTSAEEAPGRDGLINHVWFASQDLDSVVGQRSYLGADEVEPLTENDTHLYVKVAPPDKPGPYPQAGLRFYADSYEPGRFGPDPVYGDVLLEIGSVRCGGLDEFTIHYWDPESKALHLTFSVQCGGDVYVVGEVVQDMPADELDIVGGILGAEEVRMPGRQVDQYLDSISAGFVNIGAQPAGIERFRTRGPARGDYRRTGSRPRDCGYLAPGDACFKLINTEVSAPGMRRARLVADVRGIERNLTTRLRQPGLPWHDYAYARVNRPREGESEIVNDRYSGQRSGMTVSTYRNRLTWEDTITKVDAGPWAFFMEGAGGQLIEEGRYVIGPRDLGGNWLSSGPANLACDAGWFEITEMRRDDEGEPLQIAGAFDVTCEGGVRQRATFGVTATKAPEEPSWAPTMEASVSRRLVPRGGSTVLTAKVESASTRGGVIYNVFARGKRVGDNSTSLDADGVARFRVPRPDQDRWPEITERVRIRVKYVGDPYRRFAVVKVAPRPRLDLSLTGTQRGRQTARVDLSDRTWDCIRMPLQIRRASSWRTIDRQCLRPRRDGTFVWTAPEPRPRTRSYRLRAVHPTPGERALRTPWRTFRG